ncbi:hypothetical protein NBRC116587_16090 [Pseudoteredinibacter isoporae]
MHHVYALKKKLDGEAIIQSISLSVELMENVTDFCERNNVQASAIYVDADLIECPEDGQVNILSTPAGVSARLPDGSFIASELLVSPDLNGLLRRDLLGAADNESCLSYFSRRLAEEHGAQNLLQGVYSSKNDKKEWKIGFKLGAGLVVLALLFQLIYWQVGAYVFSERAEARLEHARSEYRRIFPGDEKIIDVRKQASGHLKRATRSGGNVVLLDLISVLSEVAGSSGFTLLLQSIRYDQASGDTVMVLHLESVSRAEKLTQILTERGIASSLGQVRTEGDGVVARLRIKS